jgi:hypothetical protein
MADLMTEMTKQGAIRLMHHDATFLALGTVGFLDRKRNQTIVMTGHNFASVMTGWTGEKIEHQLLSLSAFFMLERQV